MATVRDKNVNKGKRLPKIVDTSPNGYNVRLNTNKRRGVSAVESKNGSQNVAAILKGMDMIKFSEEYIDTTDVIAALRLTKDLKEEVVSIENPTRAEIKDLVRIRNQIQAVRIATANRDRSIGQRYSGNNLDRNQPLLLWILSNISTMEKDIDKCLGLICQNSEVGRWLMQINGVGPAIAASMLAHFDVTGKQYATQFISYAGLNDNNRPWLGRIKSENIVNDVVGDSKKITTEMLEEISARSQWSYEYLAKNGIPKNGKKWTKDALIKAVAKIPYNAELKRQLFIFGTVIEKTTNPDSLYANLYHQRKAYEKTINESGGYADQAAEILRTKNFRSDTDAKKAYEAGMLPPNHIRMRAMRWMNKIFVTHIFEEMYRVEYNKLPPAYYALEHCEGHHDYIGPEVPYTPINGE